MEAFVDPQSRQPVRQITLAEGETKVVGLKKFAGAPPQSVLVQCGDFATAFCHPVVHLRDETKLSYAVGDGERRMSVFMSEMVNVEQSGFVFYQICGHKAGATDLKAQLTPAPPASAQYAPSIPVVVTQTAVKSISFPPGMAPSQFDTIWKNHPYADEDHPNHKPCKEGKFEQCMVRFSTALKDSNVSFAGARGATCGVQALGHSHHFYNPYQFPQWQQGAARHHVWEASKPLQAEPMPGLAAFFFMVGRKGVVLFSNYYKADMYGGHIDFWNQDRMGNTYHKAQPSEGHSSFLRARKIEFWPMD